MRCYSTRTESLKYNISFLFNIPLFEKKNAEISLQQNFVYLEPQNMFLAFVNVLFIGVKSKSRWAKFI